MSKTVAIDAQDAFMDTKAEKIKVMQVKNEQMRGSPKKGVSKRY